MKVSEAENLVCPFMSNQFGTGSGLTYPKETLCITRKCMAWENVFEEMVSDTTYGVAPDGYRHSGKTEDGFCKRLR